MHLLQLSEDEHGVSHFCDVDIDLDKKNFAPPAPPMLISEPARCRALLYVTLPAGWGGAKHPSPRRQIAHCLAGRLRVEAGDGEIREIGPGGIWRMEDVGGSGHTTTVLGLEDVRLAIVQLE